MYATLVRARQKAVAAGRRYDAADDACTCGRRCTCEAKALWSAYQEAQNVRAEREAAWAEFCAAK